MRSPPHHSHEHSEDFRAYRDAMRAMYLEDPDGFEKGRLLAEAINLGFKVVSTEDIHFSELRGLFRARVRREYFS